MAKWTLPGAACLGSREGQFRGVRRGSLRPWLGILSGQGSVLPGERKSSSTTHSGVPLALGWQVP